ncbi:hypothetical protein VOLCADRAFT_105381 [Volvox carteri f. nagariensis]|uniref:BAR domain-containing protein n=1 Tax=Volvox carteri f. nagariensis TaxID=3068 RepID=D8U0G6_VOLCA|nr:uncharacterized protein VOLCADRAFT_105381 [Volvox carteri f. nagariensis]EFJ46717.1 hypothetical protein VOLCADRAFT_105381 [Volvox carteri f. nagariensis]|eukprot:XP_002952246.1 hypothetical protein VOLCADRAFT_105381 [Volvox carteri f. nagariensis]
MGHAWRVVMENVRQKVGADRTFKATSNARNEAMFKEATEFCTHLRVLERDLRSLHKEIDAKFTNLRNILSSPLPRAFEEGRDGAVPCTEEPKLIGQGVGVEILQQAANDLKARLDEDVIKPLRSWLIAYRAVCDRMEKLEAVRLELDSRRRTVDSLTEKVDRLEKTVPTPQQKDKHEQELEKMTQLLHHKRDKLTRTMHAYRELEQTVFNSLNTLIKDTGVLRDYTGLSLQILQECYQKAYSAFSTATPLLDYNSTSDSLFTHMPMMDNVPVRMVAPSERSRQQSDRLGARKDGMGLYAPASDDGGDAGQYGNDQQIQPQMAGYGDMQQPVAQY